MAQSGNITRTPDLVLTDTESITNAKLNRLGGGTYRLDANSVTERELSSGLAGGYDTIAALRASSDTALDGQRIPIKGYYDADAGDAGPDFIVHTEDTTTNDDGFACIVDANGIRYKRDITGQIDVRWAGAISSAAGTETNRTTNKSAWNAIVSYISTAGGGTILIPVDGSNEFYFDGDLNLAANTTIQVDGVMSRPKADSNTPWMDLEGYGNISIFGFGTIDGNSHVDGVREGGTGIQSTNATRIRMSGVTIKDFPTFCIDFRGCSDIKISNVKISNYSGSIKSGSTYSGINQDGIHFINCSDWVVDSCYIESVDDGFAYTCEDAFDNDAAKNGTLSNTFIWTRKPAAGAGSGDGSSRNVISTGIRVTGQSAPSTASFTNLTLSNIWMRGGGGIRLGSTETPSSPTYRAINNVTLNNIFIWESMRNSEVAATDFDPSWNFSTTASLYMRNISNVWANRIDIRTIGNRGLFIDASDNINITDLQIEDAVYDTANYSRTGEQYFSAINIEAVQDNTDSVHLNNVFIKDVDGSGIYLRESGGLLTNILVDGNLLMDNPNNLGSNSLTRQPITGYTAMNSEEIWIDPVIYKNFTPQSSNHERDVNAPSVKTKNIHMDISHWSSNIVTAVFTSAATLSYPTEDQYGYPVRVTANASGTGLRSFVTAPELADKELRSEFVINLVSGAVRFARTETAADTIWSTSSTGVHAVVAVHGAVQASQNRIGWFSTASSTIFDLYSVKCVEA